MSWCSSPRRSAGWRRSSPWRRPPTASCGCAPAGWRPRSCSTYERRTMTTLQAAAPAELVHDLPTTARAGMRVPARVYADDELWRQISRDRSLEQLMNVATLPGVTRCAYGMPDVHEGYGFPVGGVAAMRAAD